MRSIILVDFSWLYNRYYFVATSNNPNSKDNINPIVLRMLEEFFMTVERSYNKDLKVVIALDSPTSSLKNFKLCEDYKQNRDKEVKKEVYRGLDYVIKGLTDYLNPKKFIFVKSFEHEADQVIAYFTKKYYSKNNIIVFSGDKDLLQLTWYENVHVSDKFKQGKFILKEDKEIFEKFKNSRGEDFTRISENKRDILKYRTLRGDSSDNLKAVFPRITDKEIIEVLKYWKDESTLTENGIYNILNDLRGTHKALAQKLEDNKERWLVNYKIMSLYDLDEMKIRRMK